MEVEISPAAALSAEALEGGEEEEGRSSDRLVLIAEAGGARDRDPPPPVFHLSLHELKKPSPLSSSLK